MGLTGRAIWRIRGDPIQPFKLPRGHRQHQLTRCAQKKTPSVTVQEPMQMTNIDSTTKISQILQIVKCMVPVDESVINQRIIDEFQAKLDNLRIEERLSDSGNHRNVSFFKQGRKTGSTASVMPNAKYSVEQNDQKPLGRDELKSNADRRLKNRNGNRNTSLNKFFWNAQSLSRTCV
jgi:hypothetical protein